MTMKKKIVSRQLLLDIKKPRYCEAFKIRLSNDKLDI